MYSYKLFGTLCIAYGFQTRQEIGTLTDWPKVPIILHLVEVEGVEPSSEHIDIQRSPSADSILRFVPTAPADRLCPR